jgi:hypothetical protein
VDAVHDSGSLIVFGIALPSHVAGTPDPGRRTARSGVASTGVTHLRLKPECRW